MRFTIVGFVLIFIMGCDSEASEQVRTEGARDSAIAESAVPGAAGVRSALTASDSAAARRALEDSIMSAEDQ